jgi:hypothetical protein
MFDQFFLARKITNATLSVLYLLRNPDGSLLEFSLLLPPPAIWWNLRGTACFDKVVQHRSWTCSYHCCICRRNTGHLLLVKENPRLLSIHETQWNTTRIYLMDLGGGGSWLYEGKFCLKFAKFDVVLKQSMLVIQLQGRAMAQAVSRRALTVEARVRSRASPCGICGGQSGTGTGFSPSTSVFPCQFHSTGALLQGKTKKLIIFITGLHNKPLGCGASVASAAGSFKTKVTSIPCM